MAKHIFAILALALVALSAAPPSVQAKPCKCENFGALKSELALAMRLRAAFAAKAAELRSKYGDKPGDGKNQQANDEYQAFIKGLKDPGPATPGAQAGQQLESTTYTPRGVKLEKENHKSGGKSGIPDGKKWVKEQYAKQPDKEARKAIEDEWKRKGQDLCDPENGQAFFDDLKKGAACDGIAAAYLAHEMAHMGTCRSMGYYAFSERSTAELADDEVRGYDTEIKVLAQELQKVLADKKTTVVKKPAGACPQCYLSAEVSCGAYRVKGQNETLAFDEIVCGFEKPFTLTSISKLKFVYQMTPSGPNAGSFRYSGAFAQFTFSGTGTYTVSLKEDGTGSLTLNHAGTATTPGVGTTAGTGSFSVGLTPAECPDKQGALERDLRGLADKAETNVCRVIEPKACGKG